MIKLKHYHYPPPSFFSLFFYSHWSQQLVWQDRAGRGKFHIWFQFRASGLRGQAGQCPSGEGQVSALLRLNAHWWLLWWCGGGHGGVVINISPGLIPLVHKQRLELLWELSTKGCGPLRAVPQVCLASCWCLTRWGQLGSQWGDWIAFQRNEANGWHWKRWWQRF